MKQNGVIIIKGEIYAYVNGQTFGPFNSRGAALAGVQVEERRAAKKNKK